MMEKTEERRRPSRFVRVVWGILVCLALLPMLAWLVSAGGYVGTVIDVGPAHWGIDRTFMIGLFLVVPTVAVAAVVVLVARRWGVAVWGVVAACLLTWIGIWLGAMDRLGLLSWAGAYRGWTSGAVFWIGAMTLTREGALLGLAMRNRETEKGQRALVWGAVGACVAGAGAYGLIMS
jgi:hypothetical protein